MVESHLFTNIMMKMLMSSRTMISCAKFYFTLKLEKEEIPFCEAKDNLFQKFCAVFSPFSAGQKVWIHFKKLPAHIKKNSLGLGIMSMKYPSI